MDWLVSFGERDEGWIGMLSVGVRRADVERAVRSSHGELRRLLDGLRLVCEDSELVGVLFGRVEVHFGQKVATELFLAASKVQERRGNESEGFYGGEKV